MNALIAAAISPLAALAFSPALIGVINRTKSVFAGRKGPPLLQPYFDILRLFRKNSVFSTTTSFLFRLGPAVVFASVFLASCLLPALPISSPLSFGGDAILFLYLLGMARFFTIVAALDTGSAFEGMGASREAFFSALAEPVVIICLFALARSTGSLDLSGMLGAGTRPAFIVAVLAVISLFIILLSENARIPFDDPATHLELTMIHEVMILDHSGPGLALVEYASAMKLWLFAVMLSRLALSNLSLPLPIAVSAVAAVIVAVGIGIGVIESTMARLRLSKAPLLLTGAGAFGLLAFVFSIFTFVE